jgi:hypothetical protein
MAGLRWLTHTGKKVLLLDFSHHSGERVEQLAREVQQVVTAQPLASVLVLADFTGAKFSEEAGKQMAKVAAADRPYVIRTAWVGAESMPEVWFRRIRDYSQRDIRRFATREEALEFLVSD